MITKVFIWPVYNLLQQFLYSGCWLLLWSNLTLYCYKCIYILNETKYNFAQNSLSAKTRSDKSFIDKTMLNIIHNLNVTVKSTESNNFKMLSQLINFNFNLLNCWAVFKFERQLSNHFFLTLVGTHF